VLTQRFVLEFLDHFIGDIPGTGGKVASCPKMSPPELTPYLGVFLQHLARTATLYPLHQFAHRQFGRHRHQQMDVIWLNRST
jgi:hypothetical protein